MGNRLGKSIDIIKNMGCLGAIGILVLYVVVSGIVFLANRPVDISKIPYKIYTDTRMFMADNVTAAADGYTLKTWYDTSNEKWKKHRGSITLTYGVFGDIKVVPGVKPYVQPQLRSGSR